MLFRRPVHKDFEMIADDKISFVGLRRKPSFSSLGNKAYIPFLYTAFI